MFFQSTLIGLTLRNSIIESKISSTLQIYKFYAPLIEIKIKIYEVDENNSHTFMFDFYERCALYDLGA